MKYNFIRALVLAAAIPTTVVAAVSVPQVTQIVKADTTTEQTTETTSFGRITEITDSGLKLAVMGQPGEKPPTPDGQNNTPQSSNAPVKPSDSSS